MGGFIIKQRYNAEKTINMNNVTFKKKPIFVMNSSFYYHSQKNDLDWKQTDKIS